MTSCRPTGLQIEDGKIVAIYVMRQTLTKLQRVSDSTH